MKSTNLLMIVAIVAVILAAVNLMVTINKVGEDAFYLQLGLLNKAGNRYFPFINIGGIKNIPSIIKESLEKICANKE